MAQCSRETLDGVKVRAFPRSSRYERPRAFIGTCSAVWMTTNPNDAVSAADARDSRRWLIGVGISVAFGLFGVVMALLAYSERTRSPAQPAAHVPSPHGADAEPAKRINRRHERRE